MQYTAYRKRLRAAQKLSTGRMRPARQCLDHAELSDETWRWIKPNVLLTTAEDYLYNMRKIYSD